ncbi:MAG: hypothetical protein M6G77_02280 [Candidatus Phytoplasma vitis]|nr:MAG: hypothetical protein M6G77_02280 [Candidatus Phytoplasma vitis]
MIFFKNYSKYHFLTIVALMFFLLVFAFLHKYIHLLDKGTRQSRLSSNEIQDSKSEINEIKNLKLNKTNLPISSNEIKNINEKLDTIVPQNKKHENEIDEIKKHLKSLTQLVLTKDDLVNNSNIQKKKKN